MKTTRGGAGPSSYAPQERPPELTRSELERRFLAIVDRHGLPRPQLNTRIAGYEVDFAWPDAGLVVETDGFAAHGTRTAFATDGYATPASARRIRDRGLTSDALAYEAEIVADVATFLNRERVSPKPPSRASTSSARAR